MDISQVPQLVLNEGYPLMIDEYSAIPLMHPRFCRVVPITDDLLLGDKGSVLTGLGEPVERADGEPFARDQFKPAYDWYMHTHQWGSSFEVTERMVKAANAAGRITNFIQDNVRSFARKAAYKKDKWVADVLQQGTLTAGNAAYFDGSFPGQTDPYKKFIYDGLPFFDTAHPITIGSSTYSNHTPGATSLNHTNLQTVKTTMRSTNNVDERGDKVMIMPNTLIVPPGLEEDAKQLLGNPDKPGTANRDINIHRGTMDLIVWDFLDDAASAAAWWVCEAMSEGLVVYDRGEPVVNYEWNGERKVWLITMETHFGVVVKNWRYWYCAGKAAS